MQPWRLLKLKEIKIIKRNYSRNYSFMLVTIYQLTTGFVREAPIEKTQKKQ